MTHLHDNILVCRIDSNVMPKDDGIDRILCSQVDLDPLQPLGEFHNLLIPGFLVPVCNLSQRS